MVKYVLLREGGIITNVIIRNGAKYFTTHFIGSLDDLEGRISRIRHEVGDYGKIIEFQLNKTHNHSMPLIIQIRT
ncbi:hypothetical protein [Vulcanisaeta thermophila]|uniref:hypothetical protein n=1 Tax=Vulcanisaeta thermophila TaxID=867917 RepID=UPI0008528F8B|nr:hypothetical protein [Vulcanisaeta thermophila]